MIDLPFAPEGQLACLACCVRKEKRASILKILVDWFISRSVSGLAPTKSIYTPVAGHSFNDNKQVNIRWRIAPLRWLIEEPLALLWLITTQIALSACLGY